VSNERKPDPEAFEDPLSNYEPPKYRSELERTLAEESVSEIQSQPFATIEVTTSVGDAVKTLYETQVSSLLVVSEEKVVGIFTERDVLEKVADKFPELADAPVSDVMTADPMVVYETDPVGAAIAAIAVAGHRHVPVLRVDSTLFGIVSPRRVFQYLEKHFDTTG
jgi:CBS domain-containing protein